ncbi:DUF6930 domain-containing protein [Lyngbya sp. CCY1209]|uniref:DUF6930 domain-containing protein n=1 Tax=Lyngbya sp. CCY1209 TaxID=2886103 RepID=UPI002D207857|nr:hypothetical protein [Lyngbya sp. CCY1209]MEB3885948.1 hypothetical protein [Lyngbya sp. CCY1209]
MARLNASTLRRLQNLPAIPSVWEGDRRPIAPESGASLEGDAEAGGECIIWVDGSQGMVRAMDMVPAEMGPEAIVRTLLRAMEHPQSPTPAARPQKIVVKDREIQFFLRGVLQDLDIVIDYVPDLPLIDEIFRGLQEVADSRPPQLPRQYAEALTEKAYEIWRDAPWEKLGEHQILSLEVNQFDVGTLYVSTLGKLGMDYGVLMYRSLDSLRRFRERVVVREPFDNLEEAFLTQDCLFVTFERSQELDEDDDDDVNWAALPLSEIQPNFGNLHPLEGLRSILYDEEAGLMLVALEALHRFLRDFRYKLSPRAFPSLSKRYRIPSPQPEEGKKLISVKVETLPEVADELMEMVNEAEAEEEELEFDVPVLRDDLVPPKSFLSLGVVPWETAEYLREHAKFHQPPEVEIPEEGDGLPVILIQTSKPKAQALIQNLQDAGGLIGICFNPGEDPAEGRNYDLGILKTEDGDLHLFGEFEEDDPTHREARKKWERRCSETRGWCGLIIAMGLTGASRGQPGFKDMMALLEVRSLSPQELGLGPLQLMPSAF